MRTKSTARSAGARKAAATRRAREAERERIETLKTFDAYQRDEFTTCGNVEDGLEAFLHYLAANFTGSIVDGSGFGGVDLSVWHGDRLVGAVRMGSNGRPEILNYTTDRAANDKDAGRMLTTLLSDEHSSTFRPRAGFDLA